MAKYLINAQGAESFDQKSRSIELKNKHQEGLQIALKLSMLPLIILIIRYSLTTIFYFRTSINVVER